MQLFLLDNRVNDIQTVTNSLIDGVDFIIVDFDNDTYDTIISKIPNKQYDSVGIFQENYNLNTYQFISSFQNSILENVSTEDPNLDTWSQYKSLLSYFKNTLQINTLDLMGCNIYSSLDWNFVIEYLGNQFQITINSSNDNTGSPDFGGNWILESGNVNLIGKYFNNNIDNYQFTLGSGSAHTVFLKDDGTVYTVGNNANGQLGNGTTTTTAASTYLVQVRLTSTPTYLTGIVQFARGLSHTVFLKSDGTVYAVGLNTSGQLGDGTLTQRLFPVPVLSAAATNLSGIIQVACGDSHTVFLKSDGTVYTVGNNANGQLGNGTTTTTVAGTYPVQVRLTSTPTYLTGITQIACGTSHTVFLTSSNTVYAVGLNTNNQLGDGTIVQKTFPVQVLSAAGTGLASITQIACGASYTVFLTSTNTVYAVGLNTSGQLGNGTVTSSTTGTYPVQVLSASATGLANITQIECGSAHTAFLTTTNTAYTVGLNTNGQLGNGTTTTTVAGTYPVQVRLSATPTYLTGITQIVCGSSYTNFLTSSAVYAVGLNSSGQLGDGSVTQRTFPVQVLSAAATGLTAISVISDTANVNVPTAPTISSINAVSPTLVNPTISISFAASTNTTITNYSWKENTVAAWKVLSPAQITSPLTIPASILASGKSNLFAIRAMNLTGSSSDSPFFNSVTVYFPPDTPIISSINIYPTAVSPIASIGFSITADISITNYYYSINGGAYTVLSPAQSSQQSLSIPATGLTRDTSYTFSIKAINPAAPSGGPASTSFAAIVPSVILYNASTFAYIKQTTSGSPIQYSSDNTNWTNINWPLYIQNSNYATTNFVVKIQSNLNITNLTNIFLINGHNIKIEGNNFNITVTDLANYAGLIQNGTNGTNGYNNITIQNINIASSGTTSTVLDMGWICRQYFGYGASDNTIQNCTSSGFINSRTGGIIGANAGQNSTSFLVSNCSASGDMYDTTYGASAGGIIGTTAGQNATSFTVQNCFYSGGINGNGAGGIVGDAAYNITINNCYSSGTIKGGGIVGTNAGQYGGVVTITDCYSKGNIGSNGSSYAGGIVGAEAGNVSITRCYSIGKIGGSGLRFAGGIIGWNAGNNNRSVTISSCFSAGDIDTNCGGIGSQSFGTNSNKCTITNCYSIGNQIGSGSGGIFGYNLGRGSVNGIDIINTFSLGTFGTNGGIIALSTGTGFGTVTVSNCYAYATTTNNNGVITSGSTLVPVVSNFYSANNSWSDTTANTFLTGISTIWTSADADTPYKLINGLGLLSGVPLTAFITAGVSLLSLSLAGVSVSQFLAAGISLSSLIAVGIPVVQPAAIITNITAINKTVTFYFTQSTKSSIPAISNYSYSTDGTNYTALTTAQTSNPLTIQINELTNGTSYSFSIKSINSSGSSSASNAFSATNYNSPATPIINSVNSISPTYESPSVSISFVNPSNSTITNYSYSTDGSSYTVFSPVQISSPLTIPATGLTSGTSYTFYIKAINPSGSSITSAGVNSTFLLPPQTPTITSINAISPTLANPTVSISFTQTSATPAITNYSYSTNGSTYTDLTTPQTSSPLIIPVSGLTSGSSYTFYIKAINSGGSSIASNGSASTFLLPPDAPTITSVNAISPTLANPTVSISFTQTSATPAITNYSYSTNGSTYTDLTTPQTSSPLIIPVSGLTSGSSYTFYIKAINSAGSSITSNGTASTFLLPPPPPTITSINAVSPTLANPTVSISFTQTAATPAITNYSYSTNGTTYTDLATPQTSSPLTIPATGLTSGASYTFTIKAINSGGSSIASTGSTSTFYTPPSAPIITSINGISSTPNVSISFTQSPTDTTITNYSYSTNGTTFTPLSTPQTSSPLSVPITSLTNNNSNNTFYIKAINPSGSSTASNSFLAAVYSAPAAPTGLSINATSPTIINPTVSVSFTTPLDSTITNYSYSTNGTTYTNLSPAQTSSPLTIPVSGLSSGTSYTFYIVAINNKGSSNASSISAIFYIPPLAPTITSINGISTTSNVSISFTQSPTDSTITNYSYSTNGTTFTPLSTPQTSSPLSVPITSLTNNNSNNTFYIKAINPSGSSAASGGFDANVFTAPAQPIGVSVNGISPTLTSTTFSISFTTPLDSTITNYSYSTNGSSYTILSPAQPSSPLIIPTTGLTNGANYTVYIKAINTKGTSNASVGVLTTIVYSSSVILYNPSGIAYIKQTDSVSPVEYSSDNQNWTNISWPLYIQNSSYDTAKLVVKIQSNLNLTALNNYLALSGHNITIEGNSYNITVTNVANYAGFIQNGTSGLNGYNNITVQNINIGSSGSTTPVSGGGWICRQYFGKLTSSNTIQNCTSSGAINNNGGGIIGQWAANNATSFLVLNCSASGDIYDSTFGNAAGGIIGTSAGAGTVTSFTVQNCSYSGGISGNGSGGILGAGASNVTVTNCYSSGGIKGGGIVGNTAGTGGLVTITNCYSKGIIGSNNVSYAGGIVGDNAGNVLITNCYSIGKIGGAGLREAGGIIGIKAGISNKSVTISSCFSSGDIYTNCGGIAAQYFGFQSNTCSITNCYSIGNHTSYNSGGIVGPLVGLQAVNNVDITNCFSLGTFGGNGGIIATSTGTGYGTVRVSNCYAYATITNNNGVIGNSSTLVPVVNNFYSANNSWSDTTANTFLTGINTIWISTRANTPYKLINGLSLLSGIPLSEFITAGVSVSNLIVAGASISSLIVAGASISSLIAAGASNEELLSPIITSITSSNQAVQIYFTQASGSGLPSITNYVYSTDVTNYTALSPVQTTSPLTISGLTNGTTYSFTLQSVISSGGNSITSNSINKTIIPLLSELVAQNATITTIANYGYTNQQMKSSGYAGDMPTNASEFLTSLSFFQPSIIKLSNNITFSAPTTISNTSGKTISITKTGATTIRLGL